MFFKLLHCFNIAFLYDQSILSESTVPELAINAAGKRIHSYQIREPSKTSITVFIRYICLQLKAKKVSFLLTWNCVLAQRVSMLTRVTWPHSSTSTSRFTSFLIHNKGFYSVFVDPDPVGYRTFWPGWYPDPASGQILHFRHKN